MRRVALCCALFLGLSVPAEAQARVVHLKVTPSSAPVGKRTCFQFVTTGANAKPVSGATVRFAGKTRTTGRHGRAGACVRLDWAGRHSAWAFAQDGSRGAMAIVRAVNAGLRATGSWHQFSTNLPAWDGSGSCSLNATYAQAYGHCDAKVSSGERPFEGGRSASFVWDDKGKPQDVGVYFIDWYKTYRNQIAGFIPSRASGAFYGTWGNLPELSPRPDFPITGVHSGSDPALEGKQGGPLHINATYHNPFLRTEGYDISVNGYLFW